MRIFQMRDPTPIEAYVLAPDYERARELFEEHLQVHSGDPDTLLYRELMDEHLDETVRFVVREALGMKREGLVACDDFRGWIFVIPLDGESCTKRD